MQLNYFVEDGPVWEWWTSPEPDRPAAPDAIEVRHGYTFADINRIARMAMRRSIGWSLLDETGRYQAAYDGVVDALFAAEDQPDERDLLQAGWRQLARDYKQLRHDRGLTDDPELPYGPRFAAYWIGIAGPGGHADITEERVAVRQVLGGLLAEHRELLTAMAVYGSRVGAAAGLGLEAGTFVSHLIRARRAALRRWFDHERPPPLSRGRRVGSYGPAATACGHGHEWTPENTRWYRPPGGKPLRRVCRACERERRARREAARGG